VSTAGGEVSSSIPAVLAGTLLKACEGNGAVPVTVHPLLFLPQNPEHQQTVRIVLLQSLVSSHQSSFVVLEDLIDLASKAFEKRREATNAMFKKACSQAISVGNKATRHK
jgi:hypothetical protein